VGGIIVRGRAIDIDGTQGRGAAAGAAIGAVPVSGESDRANVLDAIGGVGAIADAAAEHAAYSFYTDPRRG